MLRFGSYLVRPASTPWRVSHPSLPPRRGCFGNLSWLAAVVPLCSLGSRLPRRQAKRETNGVRAERRSGFKMGMVCTDELRLWAPHGERGQGGSRRLLVTPRDTETTRRYYPTVHKRAAALGKGHLANLMASISGFILSELMRLYSNST